MGTSKHFVLKVDMIETRMLPRTVLNEERVMGSRINAVGEQRLATVVRSNGAPEAQISESNAGPGRK